MELKQLSCFLTVAEELSFRRAAERLHVSQPHVTRVVKALEDDVGTPLFTRTRRRIVLTPAGREFLGDARDILARAQAAKLQALRAAAGETGTLALAFVSTAGTVLMPALVRAFRTRYPDVSLSVVSMTSQEQLRALREDRIQMGLVRMLSDEPGLVRRSVSNERLYAVVPAGHSYAGGDSIRLSDLRDKPLIVYPRAEGPAIYDQIIGHCRQAGFEPIVAQECGHNQGMTGLVAAEVGIALAIGTPLSLAGNGVKVVDLADGLAPWPISLAWRAGMQSPVATAFVHIAESVQVGGSDPEDGTVG